jgi:Zn-dependent M28 family amino/carboxypeptidase
MWKMPGQSHEGALPAATAEETLLRDRLREHVTVLSDRIGERHVPGAPAKLEEAAQYVESTLRDMSYEPASQHFHAAGKRVRNVEVELPGKTRADEILVVGAHYDSIPGSPAANDNASGVAAVLEMARALRDAKLERTVRFVAFVNEEPPFFQTDLMGSRVYAKRCRERKEKIVGMITPETIGYYDDAPGSQHYPFPLRLMFPSAGNFISFVANGESAPFLREVIGSFRRHTRFPSVGFAAPWWVTQAGWSDHWSFWKEGYPALMVTDTAPLRYPYYHTAQDTVDKIDFEKTARVVGGLTRVVREIANG